MIDESSQIATFGCIDDGIAIHTKHVIRIDSFEFVLLFAQVADRLSNRLAHVLDDHVFHGDRLASEETPRVNT